MKNHYIKIRNQLATSEIEVIIEKLNALEADDEVILLSNRIRTIIKVFHKGVINFETYQLEQNRITASILDYLKEKISNTDSEKEFSVLIVNDEPDSMKGLKAVLISNGIKVNYEFSVEGGIAYIENNEVDLVVSDLSHYFRDQLITSEAAFQILEYRKKANKDFELIATCQDLTSERVKRAIHLNAKGICNDYSSLFSSIEQSLEIKLDHKIHQNDFHPDKKKINTGKEKIYLSFQYDDSNIGNEIFNTITNFGLSIYGYRFGEIPRWAGNYDDYDQYYTPIEKQFNEINSSDLRIIINSYSAKREKTFFEIVEYINSSKPENNLMINVLDKKVNNTAIRNFDQENLSTFSQIGFGQLLNEISKILN